MHECTSDDPAPPPCRPGCAGLCIVTSWGWVLDDRLTSPPAWRIAWAIHGLPNPLPREQWRDMLDAVETAYTVAVVIDGLRRAASISACHGSGVDTASLAALADRYDRAREVAA